MKRLYDFFIRIFSGKSSTPDYPYTYKEIKGNPYTNTDEDGNPLPPWVNFQRLVLLIFSTGRRVSFGCILCGILLGKQ